MQYFTVNLSVYKSLVSNLRLGKRSSDIFRDPSSYSVTLSTYARWLLHCRDASVSENQRARENRKGQRAKPVVLSSYLGQEVSLIYLDSFFLARNMSKTTHSHKKVKSLLFCLCNMEGRKGNYKGREREIWYLSKNVLSDITWGSTSHF